jgi:hypothetical protein
VTVGIGLLLTACGADERILNSRREEPTPANVESPKSTLDQEIAAMRDADFRFIWILRRKDGGIFDAADKNVVRVNTKDMNRRVVADEGRAVVIGSNGLPPKQNIDTLFAYFTVEDLSPVPMPQPVINTNSKAKK